MKNRDYKLKTHRENHPRVSIGIFFIVLGIALLVATNDMFHLGGISEYFTWESAMVFVGLILILNRHLTPGLLLIAGGAWFMIDNYYDEIPDTIKKFYWPGVIMLTGICFIISSFFRKNKPGN